MQTRALISRGVSVVWLLAACGVGGQSEEGSGEGAEALDVPPPGGAAGGAGVHEPVPTGESAGAGSESADGGLDEGGDGPQGGGAGDEGQGASGSEGQAGEGEGHEGDEGAQQGGDEGGGEGGGGEDPGVPQPAGPVAYRGGRRHSPVTLSVARRWHEIVERGRQAGGQDDVFIKVGASATVSRNFMRCIGDGAAVLDGRDHLQATIDHFQQRAYGRVSLAATVGWSAWKVIAPGAGGGASPLEQEIEAMRPTVALVMYGTNDIQGRNVDRFGDSMLSLARQLVDAGIVPVLTTIMPRDDDGSADLRVPVYNAVIRAVAQALQVPLVDYHPELRLLPDHGIGGDGIHPTSSAQGCDLSYRGLQYGYNVRNLLLLEALDRVRRAALGADPLALDLGAAAVDNVVSQLPYVAWGDTSLAQAGELDLYSGCNADQDESGPEVLYEVRLDSPRPLRAVVTDQGDVDIDVHALGPGGGEEDCLARAHTELTVEMPGGVGSLSLDSFVSAAGIVRSGEYLLVVVPDGPPAEACDPAEAVSPNRGLVELPGARGCPAGMQRIEDDQAFCIDRFEASLVLEDGGEWSPYRHPQGRAVRAVSRAGAVPQGYIDGDAAAAACAAAGKRLCTDGEWLLACKGAEDRTYPYGSEHQLAWCNEARPVHPAAQLFPDHPDPFDQIQHACINQLPDTLAAAGGHAGCTTPDGVYDLVGNLHEWTAAADGTFRGGFYVDTERNGVGCGYVTTAHNRQHWDYSTGFRCCADL